MKVEKEQLGAAKWCLTVEVPPEDVEIHLEEELKKLQKETQMPGFRRGKVPLSLLRSRFEKTLYLDVVRDKLSEYYGQALEEADIGDPVAAPKIDIVQLEPGRPLIIKAEVEVQPPIDLASYEGLTVVRERAEIGDKEVERQLERIRERHAIISDDSNPAGPESLLEADLQELDTGMVPLIGHKRENVTIDLSRAAPDFRDSLVGIEAGQSRNVSIIKPPTSPEEEKKYDHFQITIKSVKRKELPELNDDFARQVSDELNDIKSLREAVKKDLQRQIEAISYQRMSHLLAHQVVDNSRMDVPESMLNEYLDRLVADAREHNQESENGEFDEQYIRQHFREKAVWNLRWYLIRQKIAEEEGLQVEEEDLQKEYERIAALSGKKLKQVQAMYSLEKRRRQLEDDISERKVLQFLLSKAKVIDRTVSFEEFFARDNSSPEH